MKLLEAMLNRRSIRDYNDKEIPDDMLHSILEAGLLSPSSRNLYPVELIIVKDKAMLCQLARAKTAGSGMLKNASCAIVVIGDSNKSDAWIEDCSLSMIYMQLRASELGVANCWVQCRNRISQQKKGELLSDVIEDVAQEHITDSRLSSEQMVANRIAANANDKDNLSSDTFIKQLLDIPENFSVLAILSLGMTDKMIEPYTTEKANFMKVHKEKF